MMQPIRDQLTNLKMFLSSLGSTRMCYLKSWLVYLLNFVLEWLPWNLVAISSLQARNILSILKSSNQMLDQLSNQIQHFMGVSYVVI